VIIVASVSCIYGLGNPTEYEKVNLHLKKGEKLDRSFLMRKLIAIYFDRTSADLNPGTFRVVGGAVEVMPAGEEKIYRFQFDGSTLGSIEAIDAITRTITDTPKDVFIFPAKHFVTPEAERERSIADIKLELEEQLEKLKGEGKPLEAERLKRRTNYDIAMIREVGYCNGIENYSRHLSRRNAGEPPDTLLSYFPHNKDGSANFLTIIDESHVTIPQIGGMYEGDASRKRNLVAYGFRLPSALDNRPLRFKEFEERIGQVIYTSATPGLYEKEKSTGKEGQIVEQVIRPTGLVDPLLFIRPVVARPKDGLKNR
jgi:excinuclease ABC subunit B